MKGGTERIFRSVAILNCDEQATAFFIGQDLAITAFHAIKGNLINQSDIILEIYTGQGKEVEERKANIIDYSEELDVAILKLSTPITHLSDYLMFSNQDINPENVWETVGFPRDWNESEQGSRYCYIRGDIYQVTSFDSTAIYDVHLSSKYIKEDWPYSLGGLSGAPLILNGYVVGVIINEENSTIHTPVQAVSVMKISQFLSKNNIEVHNPSAFQAEPLDNRLTKRLNMQKSQCANLFDKLEYEQNFPEMDLLINSYYIKYDEDSTSKVSKLAEYLAEALMEYACALSDIDKGTDSTRNLFKLAEKTKECAKQIEAEGKLGAIMLWMLLEGIIGAPKTFTRYSLDRDALLNEIHVGIGENRNLILYMGDGKLREGLMDATREAVTALESYSIDIQDDIYMLDDRTFDYMSSSELKDLVGTFTTSDARDWDNIACELTVFTGYNSQLLKKIEEREFSKDQINQILVRKYQKECESNDQQIYEIISENQNVNSLKVNWFILPFSSIQDFKEMVLEKLEYR